MDEGAQAPSRPAPPAAIIVRWHPLKDWLRASWQVMTFRAPQWAGLTTRPGIVARLVLASYLISCAVQRALIDGPARLVWTGFLAGWAGFAVSMWLCWIVARSAAARDTEAASPATLITLLSGLGLFGSCWVGTLLMVLRASLGPTDEWPSLLPWITWLVPLVWLGLAQLRLLWRVAGHRLARAAVVVLTPVPLLLGGLAPAVFWWPDPPASTEAEGDYGLKLTEEVITQQPQLLADALASLQAPKPGQVNVCAATYAPYATEDVFMRESAAVAKTMRERFGAEGRLVELVVNPATSTTLPWAMPTNLHKTLTRMAAVMDRDRDVLFLHLTSHGGSDGQLATNTWPLETETLTPEMLKQWLDEARIRWRVISVSACYSGSWIAPLAGDGTLVMTAADATHTSYGCAAGRR